MWHNAAQITRGGGFVKREIALRVVLGLVGLALLWCLYPLIGALIDGPKSDIVLQDQMILGIYFPIGIYLLLAIRNPAENRSLILCFVWSTLAHDAVMIIQAIRRGSLHQDGLPLGAIALVCILLFALAPRRNQEQKKLGVAA